MRYLVFILLKLYFLLCLLKLSLLYYLKKKKNGFKSKDFSLKFICIILINQNTFFLIDAFCLFKSISIDSYPDHYSAKRNFKLEPTSKSAAQGTFTPD